MLFIEGKTEFIFFLQKYMYTRTFAVIELKLLLKFFNLFIFVVYYAGKKNHLIMIGVYYTQRNLLF